MAPWNQSARPAVPGRAGDAMLSRLSRYLQRDLWRPEALERSAAGAAAVRVLRLVVVIVRASQDAQLNLRAMGLVYSTLLSLVPLLAVGFSVLKAFGAHEEMRPALAGALAPLGPAGAELTDRIIEFVDNVRVGVLGAVGIVGLLYGVLTLIDRIEDALNYIWQARRSRSLVRKFSDYMSLLLVGPVLVFAALGLMAAVRSHWLVQEIIEATTAEDLVVFLVGQVMPLVLLTGAFSFVYRVMPNTRVRVGAALVGGACAALLWHVAGSAFAAFVASSSRYAAIYSSFAVLVVFLLWLHVAWLIVLVGAQVAYFQQYPSSYLAGRERQGLSFRERLALAVVAEVARRSLARLPPIREEVLADEIHAPVRNVERLVDDLVRHGVLLRTLEPEGIALARAPDDIGVLEVLSVVRDPQGAAAVDRLVVPERAAALLAERDRAVEEALAGVTLRALADDDRVTPLARYRAS